MNIPNIRTKFILGTSDKDMGEALEAADAAYKAWLESQGSKVTVLRTQHAHSQGYSTNGVLNFCFTVQVEYAANQEEGSGRSEIGFGFIGE